MRINFEIFDKKTNFSWINVELKELDRSKKREYIIGKSTKYKILNEKFKMKYKLATKKYLDKSVRALMEDDPGRAYATLKRMEAQPGDCLDEGSFRLKEHTDANLSLA